MSDLMKKRRGGSGRVFPISRQGRTSVRAEKMFYL